MKTDNRFEFLDVLTSQMSDQELMLMGYQAVIAGEITIRRNKLGMTQSEFADLMGVTQSMVSKWEKGDTNFTLRTLIEIASKLGIPMQCPYITDPPHRFVTGGTNVVSIDDYKKPHWSSRISDRVRFITPNGADLKEM